MKGKVLLMLHAHLPYVNHPDHPYFLEENWLFEAITETYIPLLMAFKRLERDNVPFGITISLSPPLIEMFAEHTLVDKYRRHLESLIELAEKEVDLTKKDRKSVV